MKTMLRTIAALTALTVLLACAPALAIRDMAGRELSLEGPARRIVVLMAGDCEILYAIGAGDQVAGRGSYCDYPVQALKLPVVQSGFEINTEQIIALSPDLVIMTKMGQTREQLAALENAGIAVAVTDAQDLESLYEAIAFLGAVTGREAEAAALTASMQETFRTLKEKAAGREGGRVYFEVSPLEWGLWAAGTGTFMDEIGGLLKLENIFADVTGWGEVSEEAVIDRAPDVIVTTSMYPGSGPLPEEEVLGRIGWEGIPAVLNRRVFNADADAITRPGPRLAQAAEALYAFLYAD